MVFEPIDPKIKNIGGRIRCIFKRLRPFWVFVFHLAGGHSNRHVLDVAIDGLRGLEDGQGFLPDNGGFYENP